MAAATCDKSCRASASFASEWAMAFSMSRSFVRSVFTTRGFGHPSGGVLQGFLRPLIEALPRELRRKRRGRVNLRGDPEHHRAREGALRRFADLLAGREIIVDGVSEGRLQLIDGRG